MKKQWLMATLFMVLTNAVAIYFIPKSAIANSYGMLVFALVSLFVLMQSLVLLKFFSKQVLFAISLNSGIAIWLVWFYSAISGTLYFKIKEQKKDIGGAIVISKTSNINKDRLAKYPFIKIIQKSNINKNTLPQLITLKSQRSAINYYYRDFKEYKKPIRVYSFGYGNSCLLNKEIIYATVTNFRATDSLEFLATHKSFKHHYKEKEQTYTIVVLAIFLTIPFSILFTIFLKRMKQL